MKYLFLVLFLVIFLTSCTEESRVNSLIENSKECTYDYECTLINSKCPFDCYQAINKENLDSVKAAINSFDSTCVYSCVECNLAKCIDSKCRSICNGEFY